MPGDKHYNLHNILRVSVEESRPGICDRLTTHLSQFGCQDGSPSPADITVSPLQTPMPVDPADQQMSEELGCFPLLIDGVAHLGFLNSKKNPVILLRMEPPYELQYTVTPRADKKLYGCFLLLLREALDRNEAALLHCSSVSNASRSAMIFGPRGSKKTLLTLFLLQAGWNYTAEDKAILHGNKLWSYSTELPVKPSHLALLPAMALSPELRSFKKTLPIKTQIRNLAQRALPRFCWKGIDRRLHLLCPIEVKTLFPKISILENTRPTDVVLLKVGRTFRIEEVTKETALHRLCITQQLTFCELECMSGLGSLYSRNPAPQRLVELLQNSLHASRYLEITIPHSAEIHSHLAEIKLLLSAAS